MLIKVYIWFSTEKHVTAENLSLPHGPHKWINACATHSLSHTDSLTSNPGSLSFPPLSSRAYDSQQLGILPSGRTTPFLEFFRVSGSPSFPQLTVYHDTLTTRYLHLHLYIRIFSTINTNQQTCLNATLVDNGVIRVEIL